MLLAGRGFRIALPSPTRAREPKAATGLKAWKTVREAIGHMGAPVTLSAAIQNGGPMTHHWHVVRDLQPQTKNRLKAAQPGQTWLNVDESVRPPCHQRRIRWLYKRLRTDGMGPSLADDHGRLHDALQGQVRPSRQTPLHDFRSRSGSVANVSRDLSFCHRPNGRRVRHDRQRGSATIRKLAGKELLLAVREHGALTRGGTPMSQWPGDARRERTTFGEVASRTTDVSREKHGKSND